MSNTNKTFAARCYDLLLQIPNGKITTYAAIATALNSKAYRAVGSAMAKNEQLINIPCHRVVKSNGCVGNYRLGTEEKIKILQKEGIMIKNGKIINFSRYLYSFN
ncbi:MAG: MGMT family protein [Gammaproteobacteria bacterium]|nr:MAG: MGMT family protein [Gammaproteobacteria bacterium]